LNGGYSMLGRVFELMGNGTMAKSMKIHGRVESGSLPCRLAVDGDNKSIFENVVSDFKSIYDSEKKNVKVVACISNGVHTKLWKLWRRQDV
jgi:hypothetical protein